MLGDMWKWVLCRLGVKNPNRKYEQKTLMHEGTSNYVNEAKSREIMLKEYIVEEFNSGRISRDDVKELEEVEKFKTAGQGLSESCTKWGPHKENYKESSDEWKEVEKKEELTIGEYRQLHTPDVEPQHPRRENAVTEVLKLKTYQPKSEIEDAAPPIDEMMRPYSKKAQLFAGVQTGDLGMTICEETMEANFQINTIGSTSVQGGSAEIVESWNVQLGRCLRDQYSSGKTSRDCLKLIEVEKELQSG